MYSFKRRRYLLMSNSCYTCLIYVKNSIRLKKFSQQENSPSSYSLYNIQNKRNKLTTIIQSRQLNYLFYNLFPLQIIKILIMINNQLKNRILTLLRNNYLFSISKTIEQMHKQNPSPMYNITPNILAMTDRKLLKIQSHPLAIISQKIISFFGPKYDVTIDSSPIVTVQNNFDVLNIPPNHISRKPTDTYYINEKQLLRTHTSAHQKNQLQKGLNNFLVFGDVYRRDEIDRYHYPVFHQMEAVSMLGPKDKVSIQDAQKDLKKNLENLTENLFGKCEMRWNNQYFPFTDPSFELEIFFDGKWVQVLGCGVIHQNVLDRSGRSIQRGWAAGLGLQRFAMRLFKIPDVRLFWSKDQRFLDQFQKGKISQFKQFSKYPACYKDLSMWIKPEYNPNDLFGIIRQIGGDLIETVNEVDTYVDKKTNRTSKTYRICFRSLERTLVNEQITKIQFQIRNSINKNLSSIALR